MYTKPSLDLLTIEATNRCNMKCKMCIAHGAGLYNGQSDGHPPFIDVDFFTDIVKQYKRLESDTKCIIPQFQGEPLLHPRFIELCKIINQNEINLSFTTNASLLDKAISEQLLSFDHFTSIAFSLDGLTKETYEKIRCGANFDGVTKNIETFLELLKRSGRVVNCSISITEQPDNRAELAAFLRHWIKIVPIISINTLCVDQRPVTMFWQPPRIACGDLWRFMIVLTNGQVVPCCRDWQYILDMGNLHDSSLNDIWYGTKYQEMRDAQVLAAPDCFPTICQNCDTWMCRVPKRLTSYLDEDIRIETGPFFKTAYLETAAVSHGTRQQGTTSAAKRSLKRFLKKFFNISEYWH